MVEESSLPPQYSFRIIPLEYINVYWYEGYQVDLYDVREEIYMNNWEELQRFLKVLQDQRYSQLEQKKGNITLIDEEYTLSDPNLYVGYTKVKVGIFWENDYKDIYRIDVGDNPNFNPYQEWIGDYIEKQTPKLDFGQKIKT